MLVTQKYKLYRSKHVSELHNRIDIAGVIYNHCIALHKRYYSLYGKSLNKYQLKKHITKLKKRPENAFWSKLGSQAIQDVVLRIDKGYQGQSPDWTLLAKSSNRDIMTHVETRSR